MPGHGPVETVTAEERGEVDKRTGVEREGSVKTQLWSAVN